MYKNQKIIYLNDKFDDWSTDDKQLKTFTHEYQCLVKMLCFGGKIGDYMNFLAQTVHYEGGDIQFSLDKQFDKQLKGAFIDAASIKKVSFGSYATVYSLPDIFSANVPKDSYLLRIEPARITNERFKGYWLNYEASFKDLGIKVPKIDKIFVNDEIEDIRVSIVLLERYNDDLFSHLGQNSMREFNNLLSLFSFVVDVLKKLHQKNKIHADMKLGNIIFKDIKQQNQQEKKEEEDPKSSIELAIIDVGLYNLHDPNARIFGTLPYLHCSIRVLISERLGFLEFSHDRYAVAILLLKSIIHFLCNGHLKSNDQIKFLCNGHLKSNDQIKLCSDITLNYDMATDYLELDTIYNMTIYLKMLLQNIYSKTQLSINQFINSVNTKTKKIETKKIETKKIDNPAEIIFLIDMLPIAILLMGDFVKQKDSKYTESFKKILPLYNKEYAEIIVKNSVCGDNASIDFIFSPQKQADVIIEIEKLLNNNIDNYEKNKALYAKWVQTKNMNSAQENSFSEFHIQFANIT